MSGYKGRFTSTLDNKSRVAVPSKLRRSTPDGTPDRFILTLGLDGCLFLFPPDYWDHVMEKLTVQPFAQESVKRFSRIILSNAEDVDLDGQSRIRIPQHLIEKSELEKEVLFIGVLSRIEIWQPQKFADYENGDGPTYESVAQELLI